MTKPRVSYSQFGEDITATNALRAVSPGFYVDVGAHHPFTVSNTALFHLAGWNGVNVEPQLEAIKEFERHRPQAINVRAAIHNELGEVTLHKFEGGKVDTVLPNRAEGLSRKKKAAGTETVPAFSLNELFERYVPPGVHVNYLSVDIEGYDQPALMAFDLDKHRPDVICVEIHQFDVRTVAEKPMVRRLLDHGYHLFAINVMSFTFVRIDAAKRLGLWQVPTGSD